MGDEDDGAFTHAGRRQAVDELPYGGPYRQGGPLQIARTRQLLHQWRHGEGTRTRTDFILYPVIMYFPYASEMQFLSMK